MIYLLYGPDTYSSRSKLRQLEGAFQEKSGGRLGVIRIDLEDAPDSASRLGRSGSLFATRQLFIVENAGRAPKAMAERVLELAASWARDRDTFAIFWEGDLGTKEPFLLDELRKLATKAQEFKLLGSAKILAWLDTEAKRRDLVLPAIDKRLLAESYGPDLWALSNELDKIQAGARLQDRRREEEKIWDFTDAFLRDRRGAIVPLSKLLAVGYEPVYLLASLSGALRALALVWWGTKLGKLRELTGHLHPFVVKKNAELARHTNVARLRQYYAALVNADLELKTGRLPSPLPLIKLTVSEKDKPR